jgi:Fe-S oxidoreductase
MKNDEKETLDLNLIIITFDVVTHANFCCGWGIGLYLMKEKPRLIHLIRELVLL